ncbi:ACT domain-containing protein [Fibrobacter sp.]|uniref:ACT domain-containing protein n=1 Tax=Fibrobacter sp. TaxID=35828 RepID=UPI00388DB8BE
MKLKKLDHKLTVCKVADVSDVDTGKDFSLIGILSKLSAILAENGVGIFAISTFIAISTFDTDYILVKAENFEKVPKAAASESPATNATFS